MDKILFVTTRNVFSTCGELRLIKNRAKALYDTWGITTDFIAANSSKKINSKNEEMGNESRLTAIAYKTHNPISILLSSYKLRREMKMQIQTNAYKCLILSGVGTLMYINYIRRLSRSIKIIADIHGADEDTLELAIGKSILGRIRQRLIYIITRYEEKRFLSKFDGMLVVSNNLVEYVSNEYHIDKPKCYVIPCALDNNTYDLEMLKAYKSYYRRYYNIKDDEILFIYSGGVSPWQCVEKSLELFEYIRKNSRKKCRLLFLSHKLEEIRHIVYENSNVIADKLQADEVKKAVCAGDYAFLIREDTITNNVAYPNKFLEYVQSGMKIITTPFVYDVANQVRRYDLGLVFDMRKDSKQKLYDYIAAPHSDDYENRIKLLNETSFAATMKGFVRECCQKQEEVCV